VSSATKTFKVVRRFQRKHHLDVDGQVGRNTWRQLNAIR
jgi:peptidoglycan hydrolase-like protein with peptidoglycan-binding domain